MLHDHQSRVRRHHEALGRNQPVRDLAGVLVQQRHRRHELPDEAERRVDVELKAPLVRDAQDVREPRPLDVVRDDGEAGPWDLDSIDATDARVVGVSEVGQSRRALAQCELEGWHGRQGGPNPEDLQELAGRAVCRDDTFAEPVAEERGFRPIVGRGTVVMRRRTKLQRPHQLSHGFPNRV